MLELESSAKLLRVGDMENLIIEIYQYHRKSGKPRYVVEIAEEGRMRFSEHNIERISIVEHQIDFNALTKIQKPHGPIEHITYTVTRDH